MALGRSAAVQPAVRHSSDISSKGSTEGSDVRQSFVAFITPPALLC